MAKITKVIARQILDSRGNPTVEVDIFSGSLMGRGVAPSGASTGIHEALELRDGGKKWGGKGVEKAVSNVNKAIAKRLLGMDAERQEDIDSDLILLDGTKNKEKLGANAMVAASMACARLGAECRGLPLYAHIGGKTLPLPMMNILNGGMHAGNSLAIQEFMIMPLGARKFSEALRMGSEIYHALGKSLGKKYGKGAKNVGDEGGYAPQMEKSEEALDAISNSISECGYEKEVKIAIDAAASSFFKNGKYPIDGKNLNSGELLDHYSSLITSYPITSLEDPFHEEDFDSFAQITAKLGKKVQIVGDDLLVTNPERIRRAIKHKSCNALLLKINQIGTVTEAIEAGRIAKKSCWGVVVSHRSGETEDTFIADFSVGINSGQIKTGSLARGERTAKYNRLLRIEEELGKKASFGKK
jgi:enolase